MAQGINSEMIQQKGLPVLGSRFKCLFKQLPRPLEPCWKVKRIKQSLSLISFELMITRYFDSSGGNAIFHHLLENCKTD